MPERLDMWVGFIAGTLTTIAFIPQLLKVVKTRSAQDLSYSLLVIFSLGVLLWLIYGILRLDLPVIIFNALTFVLSLAILRFKFQFDK